MPQPYDFVKFVFMNSELSVDTFKSFITGSIDDYQVYFNNKDILTLYCCFLIKHRQAITDQASDYIYWNLFEMAKYLL